jgi:hypothetical protein
MFTRFVMAAAPGDFKGAITTFFTSLTTIGTSVGLVVATFFVLVGGFLYMTANGSVRALDRAKTCIICALIGLGIVLTANVIAQLVATALGQ